jgi:Uma2 family endonuclease
MITLAKKLITAAEFAQMPEPGNDARQELVRGVIVAMPSPKPKHGLFCAKISRKIGNHVDDHRLGHVCTNDTGFVTTTDPDSVRGADISFWSFARFPELPDEYPELGPDLAVEVLSPGNRPGQIQDKIEEYFRCHVRMVWVVDTEQRTLMVYRNPNESIVLDENAMVSAEDVLPGFCCRVGDLFP